MTVEPTVAVARPRTRVARQVHQQTHVRGMRVELERELEAIPLGSRDYKRVIKLVVALHNAHHAVKCKGVSFKTMAERETFYFAFFQDLRRETIYRNVEPRRLAARHVDAMTIVWEARELSAGTLANYLSYLRTWCQWTGRPDDTVKDAAHYYGDDSPLARRRQAADHDHSWVAAGIDHDAVLARIAEICPYVAIQTEFSRLFAARPKEARCLRPHESVVPVDQAIQADLNPALPATHVLRLEQGTKGGRTRDVPILTERQWELIARAQRLVPPGAHLGRPGHSLQANRSHYYRVLEKAGISRRQVGTSGHGLRHEHACELYESLAGTPAPVRGGAAPDRATDQLARDAVALTLGHNRRQVTSCYLGSPVVRPPAADENGVELKST